jgi:predicted transcriptional regulator
MYMPKQKTIDRHKEPEMVMYTIRITANTLDAIRSIAKREDRTRQSLVREALQQWLERRPR